MVRPSNVVRLHVCPIPGPSVVTTMCEPHIQLGELQERQLVHRLACTPPESRSWRRIDGLERPELSPKPGYEEHKDSSKECQRPLLATREYDYGKDEECYGKVVYKESDEVCIHNRRRETLFRAEINYVPVQRSIPCARLCDQRPSLSPPRHKRCPNHRDLQRLHQLVRWIFSRGWRRSFPYPLLASHS